MPDIWKQPRTRRRRAELARQLENESVSQLPPVEINSGAIIPQFYLADGTLVYMIQANTLQGLRTFENALELSGQSVGAMSESGQTTWISWGTWAAPLVLSSCITPSEPVSSETEEEAELTPGEILSGLTSADLTISKQRQLILAAEVLRFEEAQVAELEPILRTYVDQHLISDVKKEQIVVGSAIRKLIAMLPVRALPLCEEWLRINRKTPPLLEMEVVKMVTRKLTATLPEDTGYLGSLGDQLIDLLRSYLNPRTLSKRYFGATAMEASLSLALMRSPNLNNALELLRSLRVNWFRATVARQARVTGSDLERRFPGDRSAEARRCLADLNAAAEAVQP